MSLSNRVQSWLSRRACQPFWEALHRISVRGMGYNNYDPTLNGEDRVLIDYLRHLPRTRDPIVFDVGANEGEFTARVRETLVDARIHAFEPNPPTTERLRRRFSDDRRVTVNAIGLSDRASELVLVDYRNGEGSAHATFHPAGLATLFAGGAATATLPPLSDRRVLVTTLDAYAAEHAIEHIDYLKIDVEGHEAQVLDGAKGLIADRRIAAIQLEINGHNAVDGITLYRLMRMLDGYRCNKILPDGLYPIRYGAVHELFRYANFLFERTG